MAHLLQNVLFPTLKESAESATKDGEEPPPPHPHETCEDSRLDFNSVPGKVHRAVFWSSLPLLIIDFALLFLMFYKTFKRCKRK